MPRPSVEAERREQILDAACDVIARSGVANLRMADIAKVAGVSSGMIHYYFDSKHEVVAAAFEFNLTNSLARHQVLLGSGKDPLAVLRDLVDSYLPGDDRSLRAWKVWVASLQRLPDALVRYAGRFGSFSRPKVRPLPEFQP